MGLIPVKEIDMIGLEKLKREEHPQFNYFSIFLDVPEEVMVNRINSRAAMDYEEVQRRVESSYKEREKAKELCDFIIDATGNEAESLAQVIHILDNNFFNKKIFNN